MTDSDSASFKLAILEQARGILADRYSSGATVEEILETAEKLAKFILKN